MMKIQPYLRSGLAAAAVGIIAQTSAWAFVPTDWTGASVGIQFLYPDAVSVVDAAVPVVVPAAGTLGDLFRYEITGTQIIIGTTFDEVGLDSADFLGLRFYDLNDDDLDLADVTINPATNVGGFTVAQLALSDADNVYVNLADLFFGNSEESQIVLDLHFAGTEVPEASTWAAGGMLALGLGGLWLRRRQA